MNRKNVEISTVSCVPYTNKNRVYDRQSLSAPACGIYNFKTSPAQFACVGLVLTLGSFSASALKARTGQTGRLHGELSVHYRQDFLLFLRGNADAFQSLPNAAVRANGRLVVRSGKCRNTGVGFSAKWADCRNRLIRFHGGTPPVR